MQVEIAHTVHISICLSSYNFYVHGILFRFSMGCVEVGGVLITKFSHANTLCVKHASMNSLHQLVNEIGCEPCLMHQPLNADWK